MFDLKGKTAIVTGSSMGIGSATALYLAKCGADVAVNYRTHDAEAKALASEIEKLGCKSLVVHCDVSSFEQANKMVEEVIAVFKHLDFLVNNAGINRDGVVWKMTEQMWDSVLETDLKGYFNFIRAASPYLREQGIIGLTKAVARELGKNSINVNAVAPGMILTDMMADLPEDIKQKAVDETVLGRLGAPEEVASVIAFLCSEQARHITGEVIKIDGGQYI